MNQKAIDIALDELTEYKRIGTIEECLTAREKQKPKMVKPSDVFSVLTCPNCSSIVDEFSEINGIKVRLTSDYCKFCGQALKWEE